MNHKILGLHHVTAIAGNAQENLNFYVAVLGMRLVKISINQDAPDTYHLFYADSVGTPGTDLTFFPPPELAPAQMGTGLATEVSLAIPMGSIVYWQERFLKQKISQRALETRFGEKTLPFTDPHGLRLALVETDTTRPFVSWKASSVPLEFQVRGIHSVRLCVRDLQRTEALLTRVLGFAHLGTEKDWHLYGIDTSASGKIIEIKESLEGRRDRWGTGSIHHIAWRTRDSDEEMALRNNLIKAGFRPTEQIDRFWFKSVYFREPGGVLFELATDGPGFSVDEDLEHLGERLVLPPWFEPRRQEIEAGLPPLVLP